MTKPLRLALIAALIGLGWLAGRIATHAWDSVVSYSPPFHFAEGEPTGAAPIADRVVLVLVDGLRRDASHKMPFLNRLRERGADFDCSAATPSYSRPGRAALATGAWSEIHGATTNFHSKSLGVDNIFRSAAKSHRSCLIVGSLWKSLFEPDLLRLQCPVKEPPVVDEPGRYAELEPQLRQYGKDGAAFIKAHPADLTVLDLLVTDYAAHEFGGTSAEYQRSAERSDAILEDLVSGLDLTKTAVVVTSDHGHLDTGGHGGPEPEVLATPLVLVGKGVKPGIRGEARQIDVAPTIAALLGLALPGGAEGEILVEALDLGDDARTRLLEAERRQKAAFSRDFLAAIGAGETTASAPGPGHDPRSLRAAVGAILGRTETGRQSRLAADRMGRLPEFLGLLLLPVGVIAVVRRAARGMLLPAAVAILGYGVAFRLLVYERGVRLALSAINHEEDVGPYFTRISLLAVLALVLCLAAGYALALRSMPAVSTGVLLDLGLAVVAVVVSLLVVVVGASHWRLGLVMSWDRPELGEQFGSFVDLVQVQALGFASAMVPALAWVFARLASRRAVAALALVALLAGAGEAQAAPATGAIHDDVPATVARDHRYLIYLNGRILEVQGRNAVSPELGAYEYDAVLKALAGRGFDVISELRGPETTLDYADKVVAQVRRLVAAGVPAEHVTVAGFSKGGVIALETAARLGEAKAVFVVMAGCSRDVAAATATKLKGRILSLYDEKDRIAGSCQSVFDRAQGLVSREVRLTVGLGHGTFYKPREEWLGPLAEFAQSP